MVHDSLVFSNCYVKYRGIVGADAGHFFMPVTGIMLNDLVYELDITKYQHLLPGTCLLSGVFVLWLGNLAGA